MTRLVLVLGLFGLLACSKGGAGVGAREDLIAAWKKDGLDPSAFTSAVTPVGKDCVAGTVNRVDVLICSFGSSDEAKKAQEAGLQWVGDTTGASQARASFVVAAADRRKADPSGRTINQLFKLAPK